MIKRISFLRRKEGMSHEEFFAHWTGPHADIVRKMPGIRGLRFGLVQSGRRRKPWDGVGEIWFDSVEDAKAFATEPYKSQLVEDRQKFMREAQSCFVIEQTKVAPPRAADEAYPMASISRRTRKKRASS